MIVVDKNTLNEIVASQIMRAIASITSTSSQILSAYKCYDVINMRKLIINI